MELPNGQMEHFQARKNFQSFFCYRVKHIFVGLCNSFRSHGPMTCMDEVLTSTPFTNDVTN